MEAREKRAADVLIRWRETERAMEDPAVGEAALETLRAEVDRLRNEYHEIVKAQANAGT